MKFKIILFCLVICYGSINAQKIGFVHIEKLSDAMSADKGLDKLLETHAHFLDKKIEAKNKELQEKYEVIRKGCWFNAEQFKKEVAELQAEGKALEEEVNSLPDKMAIKKAELMEPILKKIDDAVKVVALAEGYDEIHDFKELGLFYYVDERYDVTDAVWLRLGL